jgi:hypothetical protein
MIMIDTRRAGMRCRAKQILRGHAAIIEPGSHGTVVYEVENLERGLILVEWDSGSSLYAFSNEIEITGGGDSQKYSENRRDPWV